MIEVYNCYILILLFSKEHFKLNLRVVAPTQQVLGFFFRQNCPKRAHFGHKKGRRTDKNWKNQKISQICVIWVPTDQKKFSSANFEKKGLYSPLLLEILKSP